jgi:thymidylate synthase
MEFKPLYFENKYKFERINPEGYVGIVTLWTPIQDITIEEKGKKIPLKGWIPLLKNHAPQLFEKDSPLAAISNLFGSGLPQMLANMLYNPQIERIAITGADTEGSGKALEYFFSKGVEKFEIGGTEMSKIVDTLDFPLDPQLQPERFGQIEITRFKKNDLEGITEFVSRPQMKKYNESSRQEIELVTPEFNDYPSDDDEFGAGIIVNTPLQAWMEALYHLDRFGKNTEVKGKGIRRMLPNFDVSMRDPSFESDELLKKFLFDPKKLREYQEGILDPELHGQPYRYGNRQRAYWGGDALEKVAELLNEDPSHRHCLVSLWDTKKDLLNRETSPCFTDEYFMRQEDGKLKMTAHFRTHNGITAYMDNIYGMRAIQEHVAKEAGMETGTLNLRSRWLGIDPSNTKTIAALKLVEANRKVPLNINDPRGYMIIDVDYKSKTIVAQHYHPQKMLLHEYRGKSAQEIKDQLRQHRTFSDSDHAMWIGYNLAQAELKLNGEIPEL